MEFTINAKTREYIRVKGGSITIVLELEPASGG